MDFISAFLLIQAKNLAQGPLKRMAQGPLKKGGAQGPLGLFNLVFLPISLRHDSCLLKAVTLLI